MMIVISIEKQKAMATGVILHKIVIFA